MKIRKSSILLSSILMWGFILQILPTSNSETDTSFSSFGLLFRVALVLVVCFILFTKKVSVKALGFQIINLLLMVGYTWLTIRLKGFTAAYYNLYLYLILAIVLSLDLRCFKTTKFFDALFYLLCIVVCVTGILVVIKEPNVCNYIAKYYNRYWERCTYYMMNAGKPVGSYATHSIAGFIYFQFGVLLYFKNRQKFSWINSILLATIVFLMLMLRSNTAILLIGLGVCLILLNNRENKSKTKLIMQMLVVGLGCAIICINMEWIQAITGSKENGLLGRFTGASVFLNNFTFLRNNMLPIGFSTSSSIWISDCGYIVALLRGGILNVIILYGSAVAFFKRNLSSKKILLPALSSLLLFEIGYPVLMELKYVLFLPFLVIALNSYSESPSKG